MVQIAKLSADLELKSSSFEMGMRRSGTSVMTFQRQVTNSLQMSSRQFEAFGAKASRTSSILDNLKNDISSFAAVAAGALSAQKVIQYSDTYRQLSSRLSIVASDMDEVASIQRELYQIAQQNSAPLADTVDAYVRLGNSLTDVQKKQYDMIDITDLLSKTLKISGANAAGAATFLQQFGQAASSDFKAIGQELQTFADQNPYFYKIIRDEARKSGKTLKEFAKDGGLSFNFVADALNKASEQIRVDADKIQLTVSQSLTRLDNAFLNFIGNNDLAEAGTSSLAFAIAELADNFDTLATIVGVFSAAVMTKFLLQAVASRASIAQTAIAAQAQAVAVNVASASLEQNTRMSLAVAKAQQAAAGSMAATTVVVNRQGAALVASTSLMGKAAASAGLLGRGLLAAFGGPIGVAITAVSAGLFVLATNSTAAEKAQSTFNTTMLKAGEITRKMATAHGERLEALKREKDQLIENTKAEIEHLATLLKVAIVFASIAKTMKLGGLGEFASDKALDYAQAMQELVDLKKELENPDTGSLGGGGNTAASQAEDHAKKIKSVISNLRTEARELVLQNDLYGKKASLIEREVKYMKIRDQLAEEGIELTAAQRAEIEKYLGVIEEQTDALERQKEHTEQLKEYTEEFGDSLKEAFRDGIVEGESFGDVLNNLEKRLANLFLDSMIFDPLERAFKDSNNGSGLFGGLFESWLPSFAVGTPYVPHDMIAKIHKGERILTADENASLMSGGRAAGGGQGGNITIINNTPSKVSTAQDGAGGDTKIMIDEMIADRIATSGSKTNQALNSFNDRRAIRR